MAISQRLEIKQSQTLTLTPQLVQSIKLLQLSALDLSAFIETELERNPLLERDENLFEDEFGYSDTEIEASSHSSLSETDQLEKEIPSTDIEFDNQSDLEGKINAEALLPDDVDFGNIFTENQATGSALQTGSISNYQGSEEYDFIEKSLAEKPSLQTFLSEQVIHSLKHRDDQAIAEYLISNLDAAGYLCVSIDEAAEALQTDIEDVEAVLEHIQAFEPAGVFARDVRECLSLQLKRRNRLDPIMIRMMDHLDLLAKNEFDQLKKALDINQEDLISLIEDIQLLDPKPGLIFPENEVQSLIPDIYVTKTNAGQWKIELNTEALPKILINQEYSALVNTIASKKDKAYLYDCMSTANWLIKSLDQRAKTILKVATEIVTLQDDFFQHGVTHLRPMTLKTIADKIEMHESTVSRVTTNKYMATPLGIFEMKYFFSSGVGSEGDPEGVSAVSVKHIIRKLIEAETVKKVLSDDAICKILNDEHQMNIARRTVAKYRESMDFGSSVQRRKRLKAGL